LFRQLGAANSKQPATGLRPDAPPEFRAAVAEYYEALARAAAKRK